MWHFIVQTSFLIRPPAFRNVIWDKEKMENFHFVFLVHEVVICVCHKRSSLLVQPCPCIVVTENQRKLDLHGDISLFHERKFLYYRRATFSCFPTTKLVTQCTNRYGIKNMDIFLLLIPFILLYIKWLECNILLKWSIFLENVKDTLWCLLNFPLKMCPLCWEK